MAAGLSSAVANSILDALCRSVAWTEPDAFWVRLHTGDPGVAGASNTATNATRQQGTFSASTAGAITTSADITWTSVSTTETYSHCSFWSSSSGGTFLGSDAFETSRGVTAGDNFTITAGDLDLSLTPIAA